MERFRKKRISALARVLAGAFVVLYLCTGAGATLAAFCLFPGGAVSAGGLLFSGGQAVSLPAPAPGVPGELLLSAPAEEPTCWQPASAVPAGMNPVAAVAYGPGEGASYIACGAGWVRNCTTLAAQTVADAVGRPLPFSEGGDGPVVLIMHTHATECYLDEPGQWSTPEFTGRTVDVSRNMVRVGAEIVQTLNAAGISAVQDCTLHDYPSYNGSYARSRATVEEWLARCPTIRVVLDIHRDAIEYEDGTLIKPLCTVSGEDTAQVMIICGADNGALGLPNYMENLKFACRLEDALERTAPGITRPVLFDYRQYNQHLTTGSLLVEVGGHANTLPEALAAGRYVARALALVLQEG